jgi:hypothetical protein
MPSAAASRAAIERVASVLWRDFNGDFGEDLLREHLQAFPH